MSTSWCAHATPIKTNRLFWLVGFTPCIPGLEFGKRSNNFWHIPPVAETPCRPHRTLGLPHARWIKAHLDPNITLGRMIWVDQALRPPTIKEQRGYLDTPWYPAAFVPFCCSYRFVLSCTSNLLFPHKYPCLAFLFYLFYFPLSEINLFSSFVQILFLSCYYSPDCKLTPSIFLSIWGAFFFNFLSSLLPSHGPLERGVLIWHGGHLSWAGLFEGNLICLLSNGDLACAIHDCIPQFLHPHPRCTLFFFFFLNLVC